MSKNCNPCLRYKLLPMYQVCTSSMYPPTPPPTHTPQHHTHTPPTPPTTHTTTIPDHLHEITMRGGGQGWVVVKSLCFQGVAWCLKKYVFIPKFIGKKRIFSHKTNPLFFLLISFNPHCFVFIFDKLHFSSTPTYG